MKTMPIMDIDAKAKEPVMFEGMIPILVEIIPGAAKTGIRRYLSEVPNYREYSVEKFIQHILSQPGKDRDEQSLIDIVRAEHTPKCDITVDGKKVNPAEDKVVSFLHSKTSPKGTRYLYAAINVLNPQEGGQY